MQPKSQAPYFYMILYKSVYPRRLQKHPETVLNSWRLGVSQATCFEDVIGDTTYIFNLYQLYYDVTQISGLLKWHLDVLESLAG